MTSHELRTAVLRLIERGFERAAAAASEFDRLALAAFEYQFHANEPYRRFCERRGRTPGTVSHWTGVAAVPTAAFKEAALICGDPEAAQKVFKTSGTTQGPERRGVHHVLDLQLYSAAALPNFKLHVLPDTARLPLLILGPPSELAPDSSLAWMLESLCDEFGTPESAFCVDGEGLRLGDIREALERSETRGAPLALLGTAAAFAHLLDALEAEGRRFRLPLGSRAMETGGFKRREQEIGREEFYRTLMSRLGLPEHYCVAEYGMTEMCSQFYDNVLRERAWGRSPEVRYKVVPPWVRTLVVDAETLEPLPEGRAGVLRHFDLANLDSVSAIQTDDLGVVGAGGFEILGRAVGAEQRGCSIAMDEWLTAQR